MIAVRSQLAAPVANGNSDRLTGTFLILCLILGVSFFLIGHQLRYSEFREADFSLSGQESADTVSEGSPLRKVVFLALGACGAYLLLRSYGRPFSFSDPLSLVLLAYAGYCLISVLWSIQPSLTFRRSTVLACCLVAMFGFVRQLRRDQIVWLAMLCSFAFIMTGLAAEIVLGTFQPWSSDYRFAGTLHPNGQGQLCAFACLSAYALFRDAKRGRFFLLLIGLAALGLLFLSRSRTASLGLLIGVVVLWLPFAGRKLALAGVAAPFALCSAAFLAIVFGADVEGKFMNAVTLGRKTELGSFSGRVPLWQDLAPHILERPVLGRGYLTFWTPERIADVSGKFNWTIPDAHNEYIDTLLNLGLCGGGLLAIVLAGALIRGFGAYLRTGDSTYGFFVSQIVVGLASGCFESGFAQPLGLIPFITACGVGYLAFRMPAEARRRVAVQAPASWGAMTHA